MKKAFLTLTFTCFLLLISGLAIAQTEPVPPEKAAPTTGVSRQTSPSRSTAAADLPPSTDHSLNGQYQDMLRRSWTQQGYKVINPTRLNTLWRNVQDSLKAEKNKYPALQAKIAEQEKTIADLKTQVATGEQNLQKSVAAVNEVSFLGMGVDKSTYNTIMWGAVITLAVALLVVVFTAGRSIREAKYRRQLYDEIAEEYQAYKVKANDKEKKLARELQTERNRVEELLEKNK